MKLHNKLDNIDLKELIDVLNEKFDLDINYKSFEDSNNEISIHNTLDDLFNLIKSKI